MEEMQQQQAFQSALAREAQRKLGVESQASALNAQLMQQSALANQGAASSLDRLSSNVAAQDAAARQAYNSEISSGNPASSVPTAGGQKAAMSNIGASSAAGTGAIPVKAAGIGGAIAAQAANEVSSGSNKFMMPQTKGLKFGGY